MVQVQCSRDYLGTILVYPKYIYGDNRFMDVEEVLGSPLINNCEEDLETVKNVKGSSMYSFTILFLTFSI